jgi:tryptophanyl-tRNA synthetase
MTLVQPTRPVSLTGIKPTGVPHLGNYVGAIRPAIELALDYDAYYFIADYHALTTVHDSDLLDYYTRSVAAAWLACGLDPETTTFYRQSDLSETFELAWALACVTSKGLMNRAHAYKAARDQNRQAGVADLDAGINMGLYNYPVLMAADILLMMADVVPVGKDQVQHVEYARDIAERFNAIYGDRYAIKLPRNLTSTAEDEHTLPGLDGRKMSKSYNNTIPLFCDRDELRKLVRRLKSDSTPVEAPKDPDASSVFAIYSQFVNEHDQAVIRRRLLAGGFGWGELKELLFEQLDALLAEPRERYKELMDDRRALDKILAQGADKAREQAQTMLRSVRVAIGID